MIRITKLVHILIFSLLIGLLIDCGSSLEPESIKSTEHDCTHCKMKIVNMSYDAQLLTKKGRRYYFDSIECLVSYKEKNEVQKEWVKDIITKKYIEFHTAHYLQSEKLTSPMGAGLSAFQEIEKAKEFQTKYSGNILNSNQVSEFVQTHWNKNLSDKEKK